MAENSDIQMLNRKVASYLKDMLNLKSDLDKAIEEKEGMNEKLKKLEAEKKKLQQENKKLLEEVKNMKKKG